MSELDRRRLPSAVAHYLEHRRDANYDPRTDFADDAVVTDDGTTYAGIGAITAWVHSSEGQFTYTTTFLRAEEADGMITVTNRLEGDFPGGVVDLRYGFLLAEGLIGRLVIEV